MTFPPTHTHESKSRRNERFGGLNRSVEVFGAEVPSLRVFVEADILTE